MDWKPQHPAFQALLTAFLHETTPIYVVGGAARDFLLSRQTTFQDLDIVVEQPALPMARRVADRLGWAFYAMDEARDIARLVFTATAGAPLVCDVSRMRGLTIEEDLWSRDFTVNALALAIQRAGGPLLVDVCGGKADLERRILRRTTAMSLAEDPVRLLRAVRLLAQFDFTLDEATQVQIQRLAGAVKLSSPERMRDELWKMLTLTKAAWAIEELRKLGLLPYLLPDVAATVGVAQSYPHRADVYEHTLLAVRHAIALRRWVLGQEQAITDARVVTLQKMLEPWRYRLRHHFMQPAAAGHLRGEWLVWFALLHDIGKPPTRTAETLLSGAIRYRFLGHESVGAEMVARQLDYLRFSRQEVALAQAVIANHMRPHLLHASFAGRLISRRARYRFFRDVGGKEFELSVGVDIILLALVDWLATYQEEQADWEKYLRHIDELLAFAYEQPGATQRLPLVDGHVLMTRLELKPGRRVGELLEYLREAQVAGDIETAEEALTLATDWLRTQDK
jgi:poly(A) polymerase/tRNA nucleotidyltransferase (CCA-adding enzyme)